MELSRRLIPESAVYGLGGIANQAVAILLVPIYARQLGPEGVGISAVVNTTVALSLMLVSLALPQAFFRWFLSIARDRREQGDILATTFNLRILSSVAGSLVVLAAAAPLTMLLYGDLEHLPIFVSIAPIVLFDSLNTIPMSYLRARRRPRAYVGINFIRAALGSVLILSFVVVADLGVFGIVLGSAIAALVSASFGLYALRGTGAFRFRLDGALVRPMLAFCLPLVPAAAAGWALNLSDRYILQWMTDETTVGIYAMGYTVGLVVNAIVVQPFTLTWGAAAWELAKEDDAPRQYRRVMTGYVAVAAFAALGLAALGTDVIRLLVGPAFEESRFIVPFSAFAYVLYGIFTIGSIGTGLRSETRWVPLYLGVAAVAGVLANLVLVPLVGMFGAAISTLGSYALLAGLATILSLRFYPVPWDAARVVATLVIGLGLSAAALLGPDHVLWRLVCIGLYPALLLVFRIAPVSELRNFVQLLRARRSSGAPHG
jgi:O-antigen/teichoic acid export membrane protein